MSHQYCHSLTSYSRRSSVEVAIGDIALGLKIPIKATMFNIGYINYSDDDFLIENGSLILVNHD